MALAGVEVEAVLAVVEGVGVLAVDEAGEVLAGVGGPEDAAVGRGGPEGGREGVGRGGVGGSCGAAAAPGERLAAPEEELLRRQLVVRAGAVDGVGEEGGQQVREEQAGVADGGPEDVGVEVGVAAEGQGLRGRESRELLREMGGSDPLGVQRRRWGG